MTNLIFVVLILIASLTPVYGCNGRSAVLREQVEPEPVGIVTSSPTVVLVEGDVIMGISLPRHGTLCSDVEVRGNPQEWSKPLYTLTEGEVVRLREQSYAGDWVMIAPAEWIPLAAVCDW